MTNNFSHVGFFPFCIENSVSTQAFRAQMSLKTAMYLFWKAKTISLNASISYIHMTTGRFQIIDPETYGPVEFENLSYSINQTSNFLPLYQFDRDRVCKNSMSASFSQSVSTQFISGNWTCFISFFSEYDAAQFSPSIVPRVMADNPSSINNENDFVNVNFYLSAGTQLLYTFYSLQNKQPESATDQTVPTTILTTIGSETISLEAITQVGNYFYDELGYSYNPNLSQSISISIV